MASKRRKPRRTSMEIVADRLHKLADAACVSDQIPAYFHARICSLWLYAYKRSI